MAGGASVVVRRHGFTGPYGQEVPGAVGFVDDLLDAPVAEARGPAWGTSDEVGEGRPGAALSPGLERLAAGHHQSDHRGSGGLAKQDGGHYRRQRDDVHAEAPTRRPGRREGAEGTREGRRL